MSSDPNVHATDEKATRGEVAADGRLRPVAGVSLRSTATINHSEPRQQLFHPVC